MGGFKFSCRAHALVRDQYKLSERNTHSNRRLTCACVCVTTPTLFHSLPQLLCAGALRGEACSEAHRPLSTAQLSLMRIRCPDGLYQAKQVCLKHRDRYLVLWKDSCCCCLVADKRAMIAAPGWLREDADAPTGALAHRRPCYQEALVRHQRDLAAKAAHMPLALPSPPPDEPTADSLDDDEPAPHLPVGPLPELRNDLSTLRVRKHVSELGPTQTAKRLKSYHRSSLLLAASYRVPPPVAHTITLARMLCYSVSAIASSAATILFSSLLPSSRRRSAA
jgi:hypothetical protein